MAFTKTPTRVPLSFRPRNLGANRFAEDERGRDPILFNLFLRTKK
jgi:hypothetical protein